MKTKIYIKPKMAWELFKALNTGKKIKFIGNKNRGQKVFMERDISNLDMYRMYIQFEDWIIL